MNMNRAQRRAFESDERRLARKRSRQQERGQPRCWPGLTRTEAKRAAWPREEVVNG